MVERASFHIEPNPTDVSYMETVEATFTQPDVDRSALTMAWLAAERTYAKYLMAQDELPEKWEYTNKLLDKAYTGIENGDGNPLVNYLVLRYKHGQDERTRKVIAELIVSTAQMPLFFDPKDKHPLDTKTYEEKLKKASPRKNSVTANAILKRQIFRVSALRPFESKNTVQKKELDMAVIQLRDTFRVYESPLEWIIETMKEDDDNDELAVALLAIAQNVPKPSEHIPENITSMRLPPRSVEQAWELGVPSIVLPAAITVFEHIFTTCGIDDPRTKKLGKIIWSWVRNDGLRCDQYGSEIAPQRMPTQIELPSIRREIGEWINAKEVALREIKEKSWSADMLKIAQQIAASKPKSPDINKHIDTWDKQWARVAVGVEDRVVA
jgi:hypothetical protein